MQKLVLGPRGMREVMLQDDETRTLESDLDLNSSYPTTSLSFICQIRFVIPSCIRLFWLQISKNPNSNQITQWREIALTW